MFWVRLLAVVQGMAWQGRTGKDRAKQGKARQGRVESAIGGVVMVVVV
jgi:hypothetical protein